MAVKSISSIIQLYQEGQHLYQQGYYQDALRVSYKAWIKLQAENNHNKAGNILTQIGSSYFKLQRNEPVIEALRLALTCNNMVNNALTLIRLGQCPLDNG